VRNNCPNVTVGGRHRARLDPTIEIEEFVSKADIGPRYLIRSHYLFRAGDTTATFEDARADFG